MKVAKVSSTGKKTNMTVSDAVFAAQVPDQVLAQAVRVYLSNQRQGTSKVQTRSEVTRTKSKWYRQKGTGNARHGARNANIFVGGGVAHGPNGMQNWSRRLTATLKSQALAAALTLQAPVITVVEQLDALTGKTKEAATVLAPIVEPSAKVLVVLPDMESLSARALYNVAQVRLVSAQSVTALEIAAADAILLHPATVAMLEKRATTKTTTKAQSEKK